MIKPYTLSSAFWQMIPLESLILFWESPEGIPIWADVKDKIKNWKLNDTFKMRLNNI